MGRLSSVILLNLSRQWSGEGWGSRVQRWRLGYGDVRQHGRGPGHMMLLAMAATRFDSDGSKRILDYGG